MCGPRCRGCAARGHACRRARGGPQGRRRRRPRHARRSGPAAAAPGGAQPGLTCRVSRSGVGIGQRAQRRGQLVDGGHRRRVAVVLLVEDGEGTRHPRRRGPARALAGRSRTRRPRGVSAGSGASEECCPNQRIRTSTSVRRVRSAGPLRSGPCPDARRPPTARCSPSSSSTGDRRLRGRRARSVRRSTTSGPRCSPGSPRSTSRRRRACPRPATRRTPTTASASAPACGPGSSTCGRARRRWPWSPSTCSAARRCSSASSPSRSPTAPTCRSHGLFIGATHTHAGPGQFLGSAFYNRFASNRPGFDPAWTQFLVERISGGGHRGRRRPAARPGWPSAAPRCGASPATGRSTPHVRNATVADRRLAAHRKFVAVNPWLHLLRVDRRRRRRPARRAGHLLDPRHRHQPATPTSTTPTSGPTSSTSWPAASSAPPARARSSAPSRAPTPTWPRRSGPGQAGYLEAERIGRGIGDAGRRRCTPRSRPSWPTSCPSPPGSARSTSGSGYAAAAVDGIALAPPGRRRRRRSPGRRRTSPRSSGGCRRSAPGCPSRSAAAARRAPKWVLRSDAGCQPLILPERRLPHGAAAPGAAARRHRPRRRSRSRSPSSRAVGCSAAVLAATRDGGRRRRHRVVGGQRVLGLLRHPRGVRPAVLRGRPHPPRAQHPAVARRPGWPASPARRSTGAPSPTSASAPSRLPARRYLARATGRRRRAAFDGAGRVPRPDRTDDGLLGAVAGATSRPATSAGTSRWSASSSTDGTVVADDQGTKVAVLQVRPGLYAARWYGPPLGQVPKHRFVLPANAGTPELRTELFG